MTEAQNTALIQDMYAAFGRGDIATILDHCTEDIVWHGVYGCGPEVPFAGERHGKAAVQNFFKQVADSETFQSLETRDFIATGDMVVCLGHYVVNTHIGKQFDCDFAMVFQLRDGKVTRFQEFCDNAAISAAHTADAAKTRAAAASA